MQAENSQGLATVLWSGKHLIAISVVVAVMLAVAATATSDKVYEATGLLQANFLNAQRPGDVEAATEGLAKDFATVIVSPGFLERNKARLAGGRLGVSELQSRLSAQEIAKTGLVKLKAQGSSPGEARTLANQVAGAFMKTLREDNTRELASREGEIDKLVAAVNDKIGQLRRAGSRASPAVRRQLADLSARRAALARQRSALLTSGLALGASASLTGPSTASSDPIKPRPVLNLLAGLLLGLLVGGGLAWLRERFGTDLHSSSEAAEHLGIPVLGSIPLRRRFVPGDPVLSEGYQILQTNLIFQSHSQGRRMVTFASYNRGEGKTSAIEGLAYASVRTDANVLIVDGDLRTRTLSEHFGQADTPGLTDWLLGTTREPPILPIAPGVLFLPAGTLASNPPSLFYSVAMKELMSQLRNQHELIVIDSPPAANLADALILASYSDCIALVVRIGVTRRADLDAVGASFRHSGTPIGGAVVLEPRAVKAYAPAADTASILRDTAVTS